VYYGAQNSTLPLQLQPHEGYAFSSVKVNGTTVAVNELGYLIPVGNRDVYIDAEMTLVGDPVHEINLEGEWRLFRLAINSGHTYQGETVNLNADIDVNTMVGSDENICFQGTFDGHGHTLKFTASNTGEVCAPFRFVNNATIKNLCTTGTIETSNKNAAGIVGKAFGTMTITNSRSAMEITSTVSGDGTHGGLVADVRGGSTTIEGCIFNGKLLGSSTHHCGGLVGWTYKNATVTLINCFFAPSEVTVGTNSSRTLARYDEENDVTLNNCFYFQTLGTAQGKYAHSITPGEFVIIGFTNIDESTVYAVSGITTSGYGSGLQYDDTIYAGNGETVYLDLIGEATEGFNVIGFNASNGSLSGTDGAYLLVLPDADVVISAVLSLDGEPIHDINTVDDWNRFATSVNYGCHSYSGETVNLNADLSIDKMIGSDASHAFLGTFEGNGHTLTFDLNSDADWCAPFAYTYGATIQNLATTGIINTSGRYAGGVVGRNGTENLTMTNVTSDVSINSTYNGDACHGGLVGYSINSTFTGCSFTGSLLGESSTGCSGLQGWNTNTPGSSANFTNCLFAPTNVTVSPTNSYTFVKGSNGSVADITNCYYFQPLGTAQGKQAHSITGNEGITVTNAGTATEYTVAGFTNYGMGVLYQNVLYASNGDVVSLNFERETEPGFASAYSASAGTLSGTTNPYTLTMPDEDVVITAETVVGDWDGTGTEEDPYIIYTIQQLDLLRNRVHSTNGEASNYFNGKFFLLANDLEYTCESEWNDLESEENNYAPIGTGIMVCFKGTFDGGGHTISGIRIYDENTNPYRGVFGYFRGTVKNLTVSNFRIVGRDYEGGGGIVGYNDEGTVSNCHATATVAIHIFEGYSTSYCGGVVGFNRNSGAVVNDCSSAASITTVTNQNHDHYIGGVVGRNFQGVMHDNLAIGATITPGAEDYYSYFGAIVGDDYNGTLERNYYANCTVNGVGNATGVGTNNGDITLNDGAVLCPTRLVYGYGNYDGHYVLLASPIGTVNPSNISRMFDFGFDLYRFNQDADLEWENWKSEESEHYHFDLEPGRGYLYANKGDVYLTFPGRPYHGSGEVTLTKTTGADFEGWNLVGNPFNETVYIADGRSFYTMNPEGNEFIAVSNESIEAMEGVFVVANEDGETINFTTTEPANNGKAMLALNLSQGNGIIDRAIVRFNEGDLLPKFQINRNSTKVYISMDGQDYAVVRSEDMGEMPVSFKAKVNGTYTLSLSSKEVEFSYLHLIDNLTGNDVDMLATPSYSFEAKTTDYESRFKLVFATNDGPSTGSGTFAFYSNGSWIISNEGEATLQVIDVNGRILSSETVNGSVSKTIHAAPSVYVLRLINGDDVKTQKIVID
jgi:hypothetical protein